VISYQYTSTIIAIIIAFNILFLIRRDILHTRYALWWFVVAALVMLAGIFPKYIDAVTAITGIKLSCHDLRRTFATLAKSLDLSSYTVKALLNHRQQLGDVIPAVISS